ncbi:class I SAM-dependent DNA methyltransferase [Microlunatus flavus]|uniref:Methyltransferase domain-containing protein n=1 Tax=Microlunatus flavus TaxID=1036181 RepID=A0A1H8ZDE6_9ACTN|nr:class I SAM-dependent methyltransferase [Microlunatus flavus]SEP62403.1 Methyltransferase domain-containing protein [Microlunatus flavus]
MAHEAVGAAYDTWADAYAERFGDVDRAAPPDRALVERWCDAAEGPLLDAGCGPGHWTALLAARGRSAVGLDLSARFLAHARATWPGVAFVRASADAVPLRDGCVGGVLAWYSLIHQPPQALPATFAELRRVLRPDSTLLLGFVDGEPGAAFAHTVVTAYAWSADALADLLAAAGLEVVEEHHRRDEGVRPHGALLARATEEPLRDVRS